MSEHAHSHSSWGPYAHRVAAAAGRRSGGARTAIVDELAALDCCTSAQELHDRLRGGERKVGIASVYRVLDELAGLGLVARVDLGDGVARYEPVHPSGDHHHHALCVTCGRIEPFDDPALEAAIDRAAEGTSYDVMGHDVVLRGRCAECADHSGGGSAPS